jgi:periplasmic protein CpxP/Spy
MSARKFLLTTILAMAGAIPLAARAQTGPGLPGPGPGGPAMGGPPSSPMMGLQGPPTVPPPFMMALRSAKLTPDQETKLREILDSDRSKTMSLMKQLHSIHEQIATKLLSTGTVTEADLAPLSKQAAQIDEQIQQQGLSGALRIRAILTREQIVKMNGFNAQMITINAQIQRLLHGPAPAGGDSTP